MIDINDLRKLTFTVDEICSLLSVNAAKQLKIAPRLVNDYVVASKHDYLPLVEYLLDYQAENTPMAEVTPTPTPTPPPLNLVL